MEKQSVVKSQFLTVENLQRLSENWNGKTKEVLIFVNGAGSMWGGWSVYIHATVHGANSIYETGLISIEGMAHSYNNIARGANGENSETFVYYELDASNRKPANERQIEVSTFNVYSGQSGVEKWAKENKAYEKFRVQITGEQGGAEYVLLSGGMQKDWIKK